MSFVENVNKLATAINQSFIDAINSIKGNEANITTVGQNISDVTAVADSIVPNITEILLADTNASIATTKASEASASALAALSSQNAAATSANTAASLLDQFDDRYLGAKTSDPTLDNDGNALLVGALYFNSSSKQLKVWNGSVWSDTALQLNNTLTSTSTTQALTAAQGKVLQDSKEPAFTKNTGFNKNLGTSAGTVLEGSHYGSTGAVHGVATTSVAGFMSASDKVKLDGVAIGAEVNQNSFSNIAVSGQTTVAADAKSDTLTLIAGTNVTITTDAVTDSVTISANDTSVAFSEVTGKPTSLSGYGITDGQPLDATLTALAGVATAADKLVYATGSDVFSTTTLTSFGRSLIDDPDATTALATLGALPSANPSYTGTLTGGTGVVNLGSGQFVKDASGNIGIGTSSPSGAANDKVVNIKSNVGSSVVTEGFDSFTTLASGYNSEFNSVLGYKHGLRFIKSNDKAFDTYTEHMCIDSAGNVGIGVTPWSYASNRRSIDIKGTAGSGLSINTDGLDAQIWVNAYYDGTMRHKGDGPASSSEQYNGAFVWRTAPAGTAGNTITWNQVMTLNANGNLLIGTTTDNGVDKLQVNGSISEVVAGFVFRKKMVLSIVVNAGTSVTAGQVLGSISIPSASYGTLLLIGSFNNSVSANSFTEYRIGGSFDGGSNATSLVLVAKTGYRNNNYYGNCELSLSLTTSSTTLNIVAESSLTTVATMGYRVFFDGYGI